MNRLYKATPDGYCGDEDNGQTSAWYLFSAMGFYPVTPATDQYVLGAPLFKKVTIRLQNGRTIILNAPQNSDTDRYVSNVLFNGKPYTRKWFSHKTLVDGAVINFTMGATPGKKPVTQKADLPYSISGKQ